MMAMMTPLSDAWGPSFAAGGSAGVGAGAGAPPMPSSAPRGRKPPDPFRGSRETETKIPYVDYANEMADVRHYCKTYGVMCEKSPARNLETFEGLTEDELNDVFVPIARPQIDASFSRLEEPPMTTQPPAPLPVMTPADFVRDEPVDSELLHGGRVVRNAPRSVDSSARDSPAPLAEGKWETKKERRCEAGSFGMWFGELLSTSEAFNLALFALAGLLLIFALDQMVRIGIEISRARIGMAVALRNAAHVAQSI